MRPNGKNCTIWNEARWDCHLDFVIVQRSPSSSNLIGDWTYDCRMLLERHLLWWRSFNVSVYLAISRAYNCLSLWFQFFTLEIGYPNNVKFGLKAWSRWSTHPQMEPDMPSLAHSPSWLRAPRSGIADSRHSCPTWPCGVPQLDSNMRRQTN